VFGIIFLFHAVYLLFLPPKGGKPPEEFGFPFWMVSLSFAVPHAQLPSIMARKKSLAVLILPINRAEHPATERRKLVLGLLGLGCEADLLGKLAQARQSWISP
jgi:hypothetical protein